MAKIVIIGSGNVAENLAVALAATGESWRPVQVFARNRERGERVARLAGCKAESDPQSLAVADLYLIAVSDRAVVEVSHKLRFGDAVVAHTAGSVPLDALPEQIRHRGVFYPLQTFTAGRHVSFYDVPIFIEGEDRLSVDMLTALGTSLCHTVHEASSVERGRLHLAAVFACNFANHMVALGEQTLSGAGMPAQWIRPLVRETVDKMLDSPCAAAVQTGPAVRGDLATQQRHLELLDGYPELQNLYREISQNIWEISKKI